MAEWSVTLTMLTCCAGGCLGKTGLTGARSVSRTRTRDFDVARKDERTRLSSDCQRASIHENRMRTTSFLEMRLGSHFLLTGTSSTPPYIQGQGTLMQQVRSGNGHSGIQRAAPPRHAF